MSKSIGLNQLQPQILKPQNKLVDKGGPKADFEKFLKSQLKDLNPTSQAGVKTPELTFSNHAVERMKLRGVQFSPAELNKINTGIEKARLKGAKESLLLTDNAAMIVNVKNNKVVTVMDKANMKENVFTNIDSTILV